jgi:hypothetical protein
VVAYHYPLSAEGEERVNKRSDVRVSQRRQTIATINAPISPRRVSRRGPCDAPYPLSAEGEERVDKRSDVRVSQRRQTIATINPPKFQSPQGLS